MNREKKRDWASYDRKLVQRGELLISLDTAEQMKPELERMNDGKEGARYRYPDSLMECLGFWKCFCKMAYRTVEGIAGRLLAILGVASATPDHTVICRRLRKLGRRFYKLRKKVGKEEPIYAVFDGSGLKVCNRGEWMHYKHKGKRKGFVRICFMINAGNGELLDFSATTECVGEQKKIRPMLKRTARNRNLGKLAVDGAGDDYRNFELAKQLNIKSAIKIRSNANPHRLTYFPRMKERLKEVRKFQRWGYDAWAKKRDYGQRWQGETAFSCFKGYFGEYVYSKGMSNIKSEIGLKAHYYNQLRSP
jgi:hypothetical protein